MKFVKFVWKISYPPVNGESPGNYFLPKMWFQPEAPKFKEKGHFLRPKWVTKTAQVAKPAILILWIWCLMIIIIAIETMEGGQKDVFLLEKKLDNKNFHRFILVTIFLLLKCCRYFYASKFFSIFDTCLNRDRACNYFFESVPCFHLFTTLTH